MNDFEQQVRDSRGDWELTTWADGFGRWHARVSSAAGWGNAGVRDVERHLPAMRERARRAIRDEITQRQALPVGPIALVVADNVQDAQGVFRSFTFAEAE